MTPRRAVDPHPILVLTLGLVDADHVRRGRRRLQTWMRRCLVAAMINFIWAVLSLILSALR